MYLTILVISFIVNNTNKNCNKQSCFIIQNKLSSWIKVNYIIQRTCCYAQKGFAIEAGNWILISQTLSCKTDYNQKHTFFDTVVANRSVAIKPSTRGPSILAQSEPCKNPALLEHELLVDQSKLVVWFIFFSTLQLRGVTWKPSYLYETFYFK